MKKKLKNIAGVIVTVCLTALLLSYLTDLLEGKESVVRYEDFFNQEEDFDVLFMGTSHIIDGVFPMELWNDYGLVSYNCGGHANRIATTYWVMENALEQTDPKVVVIDCMMVSEEQKYVESFSMLHWAIDIFPLRMTKIKAVWDLLDDPVTDRVIADSDLPAGSEQKSKTALLWNYLVYHSRWNELSQNDFEPEASCEKGAIAKVGIVRSAAEDRLPYDQKMEAGTVGDQYLRRMIEDCQRRGIEVLLTYLPFPAEEKYQKEANYIAGLAEEYGVDYINFLDMDVIDYQTDIYDKDGHLNPSGARKVTDYLGKYLVTNYGLQDHRSDDAYATWYTDYEKYTALKDSQLTSQQGLAAYLMLLSGDDLDIILDIRNKDIYKNEWFMELLKNAGVGDGQLNEDTDFIIKTRQMEQAVCLDHFRESGSTADTPMGTVRFVCDDSGAYEVTVDGSSYLDGNTQDSADMRICVRRDGEIIDNVGFEYYVDVETTDVEVYAVSR